MGQGLAALDIVFAIQYPAPTFFKIARLRKVAKMAKRYCGNFPSDGYDEIGSFKAHGHDWSVWLNEKTIHQKWKSVKVCSVDPVPRKANYWLSWNGERFALNADGAAMQEHRPDIGKKVSELLEGLV